MKILYLSCHLILEYDELKLFHELGHEFLSLGAYTDPSQENDMRPSICAREPYQIELAKYVNSADVHDIDSRLIDWADVIIIMHRPDWIKLNWEKMKHKIVIWRTIGQSVSETERMILPYRQRGLKIVRYSPTEASIPAYNGSDAMIRFYKDPKELKGWTGIANQVITVAQNMKERGSYCNYQVFHEATEGLNARLFGPQNDNTPEGSGQLSYSQLKMQLQESRAFFYTGTHPASYTLGFMEALMTGTPIVSIGHGWGNSKLYGQRTFEVPDIIKSGYNGFVSDDPKQLNTFCKQLLADDKMARHISGNGRRTAIELFGVDNVREQWKQFLNTLK